MAEAMQVGIGDSCIDSKVSANHNDRMSSNTSIGRKLSSPCPSMGVIKSLGGSKTEIDCQRNAIPKDDVLLEKKREENEPVRSLTSMGHSDLPINLSSTPTRNAITPDPENDQDHKTFFSLNDRRGSVAAAREKEERDRRRQRIQNSLDAERLKADIYRDYTSRRDGFDLGGQRRKARRNTRILNKRGQLCDGKVNNPYIPEEKGHMKESSANKLPKIPNTASGEQSCPLIPGGKSRDKRQLLIARLEKTPRRSLKKGLGISGSMGLTVKQIKAFREVFDIFDCNGGGTIDANELDETLRSVNICLTKDEIKVVMTLIDKDGNGEIDFSEFLQLMTNTERFLESLAPTNQTKDSAREHLLFDALTEFMKKSALHSMDELVGYYHTKYKRAQEPHVVNHYAAGARLIGLNEQQLKRHLETLKATNAEDAIGQESPYARPLHIVASSPNTRLRGVIRLKIKHSKDDDDACSLARADQEPTNKRDHRHHMGLFAPPPVKPQDHGWMSQRTEHIEVKLPSVYLHNLQPFDALTAEDLPTIRTNVQQATTEYSRLRNSNQKSKNLDLWKSLDFDVISPPILRNHFRIIFSHYSSIQQAYLV